MNITPAQTHADVIMSFRQVELGIQALRSALERLQEEWE